MVPYPEKSCFISLLQMSQKKDWDMGVVSFYLFFLFIERGKKGEIIIHEGGKFNHSPSGNVYLS